MLHFGEALPLQFLDTLKQKLKPNIMPERIRYNVAREQDLISRLPLELASLEFSKNRMPVLDLLQAISAHFVEKYSVDMSCGLDIGSGGTGFNLDQILRPLITKSAWVMSDIHKGAVNSMRQGVPDITACELNYLDLPSGLGGMLFPTITGLSCLDATYHLDKVAKSVADSLHPGGYFLHVQDVRPGVGVNYRVLEKRGWRGPNVGFTPMVTNSDFNTFREQNIIAWNHPEGKIDLGNGILVNSVAEHLKMEIDDAINAEPKLELLESQWVTMRVPCNYTFVNYLNLMMAGPGLVPPDKKPLHRLFHATQPFRQVSAVVHVARKV